MLELQKLGPAVRWVMERKASAGQVSEPAERKRTRTAHAQVVLSMLGVCRHVTDDSQQSKPCVVRARKYTKERVQYLLTRPEFT